MLQQNHLKQKNIYAKLQKEIFEFYILQHKVDDLIMEFLRSLKTHCNYGFTDIGVTILLYLDSLSLCKVTLPCKDVTNASIYAEI